ncbi:hypothetical protein AGLY_018207 [Aphis glycines]|uniref:Endonuclease/exonuclease/phosphatase domain-containing protein n=1 Tax=Aphis glycines TaxID=307491 RepID=A0A6G0STG1_APHGL|nr:hypothetical protein AGLY_018207 [Aphis glycines]
MTKTGAETTTNSDGFLIHTPAQTSPEFSRETPDREVRADLPAKKRPAPAVAPIKVIQLNAARSKLVAHQLLSLMEREKIDLALIQEPATDGSGIYLLDRNPLRVVAAAGPAKSAIVVANPAICVLALRHLCTPHIAVAKLKMGELQWTVVSSYFQFAEPTILHADALGSVLDATGVPVLICADVNARAAACHDPSPDERGDIVVEMNLKKNLRVLNEPGRAPTFRNSGSANLDVTLASPSMARRVKKWTATHDLTSSDHAVIAFEIEGQPATPGMLNNPKRIRYNWRSTDWTKFGNTLKVLKGTRSTDLGCPNVETCTRALTQVLATACETHMSRVKVARPKPAPWWNSTLEKEVKILGRW